MELDYRSDMQVPSPISLANDSTKSEAYFRATRWKGRRYCPKCLYRRKVYRLGDGRYKCRRCSYRFRDFTGTYLQAVWIPFKDVAHLLYLFVLGVPAHGSRRYVDVSPKTARKVYSTFRRAIYDRAVGELEACIASGEIEVGEAACRIRRSGELGWGDVGRPLVLGLHSKDGQVVVFPVSEAGC